MVSRCCSKWKPGSPLFVKSFPILGMDLLLQLAMVAWGYDCWRYSRSSRDSPRHGLREVGWATSSIWAVYLLHGSTSLLVNISDTFAIVTLLKMSRIFGTSKDINIGPVAVLSIVTGVIVTEAQEVLPEEYERYVIASTLALLSGCLVTLVGLLRLGWLVDFIAQPAVDAFVTGSGITISLGQIPTLLGINGVASGDPAYLILIHILTHLRRVRIDAVTGISALASLYMIKITCEWASKRWPSKRKLFFFMSCLRTVFILLLFTLISFVVNHQRRQKPKFSLIGYVPSGEYTQPG